VISSDRRILFDFEDLHKAAPKSYSCKVAHSQNDVNKERLRKHCLPKIETVASPFLQQDTPRLQSAATANADRRLNCQELYNLPAGIMQSIFAQCENL